MKPGFLMVFQNSAKVARRLVVIVLGGTVTLIGLAMILLPGPAIVVIPIGLGILGIEFTWARRLLLRMKETGRGVIRRKRGPSP